MAEHVPTTRRTDLHPSASTGRRSLLSAAPAAMFLAGAGLAGAVQAAAPAADAELLALCTTFHRQDAASHDEGNLEWEKAGAAAWGTFQQLDDMTPVTEAGHRAKAGVAVKMLVMFHEGQHGGDPEAVFALNLLRDWLGEA